MFDSFDQDRDGKLSRDELVPVFLELLQGVREKAIKDKEKTKNEWKEEVDQKDAPQVDQPAGEEEKTDKPEKNLFGAFSKKKHVKDTTNTD